MLSTLTRAYRALADSLTVNFSKPNRVGLRWNTNRNLVGGGTPIIEPLEERALMSTYYVSTSGSDSNGGTSAANAWKSISKVNSINLNAGDSVLFQGGQTFYGSLNIGSGDSGSSSTPVTFGSYNGRATLNSGKSNGALVNSATGVWFENLKFVGSPGGGTQSGILWEGYARGSYLSNDRVDNCDISGYYYAGILVEDGYTNGGFTGMRLTNNSVYNNVQAGIETLGPGPTSNYNTYVAYNQVYNNYGDGTSVCTGNGIELGGVTGATVEYNVAYLNGSKGGNGGVGIWAYDANQVLFQYNESYSNKSQRGHDGDGFDFDANVSNSITQYNYAFGNDGTGAQLDQWQNNSSFTNDIIRYNVFQDNGRLNNYGNLEVWGKVSNSYLYNNVIYTTPGTSGSNSAIRVHNSAIPGLYVNGVHFVNNIIDTANGATLINVPAGEAQGATNLTFTGNLYWTNGAATNIVDGRNTLHSLASWQSAGQESWSGKKVGIFANPQFANSNTGAATPLASTNSLASAAAGYKLLASSPALGQKLSVASMYGITNGGADFYGDSLSSTAATVPGADQSRQSVSTANQISGSNSGSTSTGTTGATSTGSVPKTNGLKLSGYDLGYVGSLGSNSSSNGTFHVTAGGADIWGSNDAFRFDETTMTGNGTIVAKVSSMTDANAWAKAGLMIRSGLGANATEASVLLSPDHSANMESRFVTGGATSTKTAASTGAAWVKLTRVGNTFSGYISSDGIRWTLVNTTNVNMSQTVLVGLAVTAHVSKGTETAVFSNVSIT